jgi:DNA-directed RNA polymerase subunit RPC12/RpoP
MSTTTIGIKRCIKCGADVTGQQRMKNAKGEYWCMDCGAKEEAAKSANLVNPCPSCHKPVHAAHLVRHEGHYVCEACASGAVKPGANAGKKKLIVAVILLVAGAIGYVLMNFVLV